METGSMPSGQLYVISAPSGAGKTSLVTALLQRLDRLTVSVSHTTRAPRTGEADGQHYHFTDVSSFEQGIAAGQFLEYAQVFDHYYGTSQLRVEAQLVQGIDVILEIDWQGAAQVFRRLPQALGIFILPPSLVELEKRLRGRGTDADDVIAKRLTQSQLEISKYTHYDYVVINDDFDQALHVLMSIFTAQRARLAMMEQSHRVQLASLLP